MKIFIIVVFLVSLIAPQSTTAQGVPSPLPNLNTSAIKIILAGDSTTAQQTGWGGAFCDIHVTGMTSCLALGRGGRSTKTYRNEGSWDLVLNELRVPGYQARYVLLEFGHNDKNGNPAIGTSLEKGEFAENLVRFVEDVRNAGGTPILVSPLAARHFRNNQLDDTLVDWAKEVRAVAEKTKVQLIDLNQLSGDLYKKMGALAALDFENRSITTAELDAARVGTTLSARTFGSDEQKRNYGADYIHLNRIGAEEISKLVAQSVRNEIPSLRSYVIP